jgi:hypothetical protein
MNVSNGLTAGVAIFDRIAYDCPCAVLLVGNSTIVCCLVAAQRKPCRGLVMVILYSLDPLSPAVLKTQNVAISTDNDRILQAMVRAITGPVVCGRDPNAKPEGAEAFPALPVVAVVRIFHFQSLQGGRFGEFASRLSPVPGAFLSLRLVCLHPTR